MVTFIAQIFSVYSNHLVFEWWCRLFWSKLSSFPFYSLCDFIYFYYTLFIIKGGLHLMMLSKFCLVFQFVNRWPFTHAQFASWESMSTCSVYLITQSVWWIQWRWRQISYPEGTQPFCSFNSFPVLDQFSNSWSITSITFNSHSWIKMKSKTARLSYVVVHLYEGE